MHDLKDGVVNLFFIGIEELVEAILGVLESDAGVLKFLFGGDDGFFVESHQDIALVDEISDLGVYGFDGPGLAERETLAVGEFECSIDGDRIDKVSTSYGQELCVRVFIHAVLGENGIDRGFAFDQVLEIGIEVVGAEICGDGDSDQYDCRDDPLAGRDLFKRVGSRCRGFAVGCSQHFFGGTVIVARRRIDGKSYVARIGDGCIGRSRRFRSVFELIGAATAFAGH